MAAPLAGRRIVVTRPRDQAVELAAAIRAAGGEPIVFPLLEIVPLPEVPELRAAAVVLADYAFVVFISPNAVAYALPELARGGWPAATRAVAIGPGGTRALAAAGVGGALMPAGLRFDSEALLAQPELAPEQVAGRKVLIVRGDGGRELLADTLRARGAAVDCVACYRRQPPAQGAALLLAAWREGIDAFTVSSSEALGHLVDLLDPVARARLRVTPIFVPHARIADTARRAGLERVEQTAANDAGMVAGLCAYNWPS
jgi:uroporphyrinogen-III synthase